MSYLIIAIIVLMIIIGRVAINDKLSKTIIVLYLLWWGIWLVISTFNFYELFSIQASTYLILVLNVVMFYIGFLFCGDSRYKNEIDTKYFHDKISKKSLFFKMLIIVVLILLYYWLRYSDVVHSGISLNNRMERFIVGNVFSSGPEILFFNYFIESFIYAVIIIFAYMIIYNELRNIVFVLITISLFLYSGIGSGRGPIIEVLIAMSLIFFIRKIDSKKKTYIDSPLNQVGKIKKMKSRNILLIAFVSLIIMSYLAWLTALRMGYSELNLGTIQSGWNELFRQIIIYCTGPFRALDYGLKMYPENINLLFGRGTFAGIDEIVNIAARIIGVNYSSANGVIGQLLQNNQILIGNNISFNYAYTSVMIYYFDLGTLGVIIFPFLYGFFVRKAIYLYEKTPLLPTLIILTFLFTTMLNSVFKWGLQSPSSNIALIGCYLWYRYKYMNHRGNIVAGICKKKEIHYEYTLGN